MAATGSAEEVAEVAERFSLSVFATLRDAQTQQGLKHADYVRYSGYCTRRLRRLYKSMGHKHGKGKYEGRELAAEDVKEARHFLIPLMCAERCWAQALEIKKEIENTKKWRSHRRQHMVKKLRRATKWADELVRLCAARATTRTAMEAEAYASFLKGTQLMEVERRWQGALQHFLQARALYEKLARGGGESFAAEGAIFLELQSEVEPMILFCKYQQQKAQGTSKLSDLQELREATEGASSSLRAQLDTLMSEAEESASLESVEWRGRAVAIPAPRLVSPASDVVAHFKKMEEDGAAGAGDTEALERRLGAYGTLFTLFDTVRQVAQSEKAEVAGGGASAMSQESQDQRRRLEEFERCVSGLMLESKVRRNLELIQSKWASYVPSSKEGRKAVNTTPEEMYRLHEHLKLDVFDLSELASAQGAEDEALYEECSAAMAAIKAILCFFLGEQHNASKRDKEAYLLYNRAVDHGGALEEASARGRGSELFAPILKSAEDVSSLSRIGRCIAHARACVVAPALDRAARGGDSLESAGTAMLLLENLSEASSFVGHPGRKVCALPPTLELLPCQPFLLDTAIDHIEYPEVPTEKTRAKEQERPREVASEGVGQSILGGVTSMFGWGSK